MRRASRSGPSTLHEKAIYLLEGGLYQVEKLDFEGRKAYVRQVDCDYYTDAITYTKVTVLDTFETQDRCWIADAAKTRRRSGSRRLRTARSTSPRASSASRRSSSIRTRTSDPGELDLPEQEMHTTAYWLTLPRAVMGALPYAADDRRDGVVGLSFAMRQVAQLLLMCDRQDIGISIGSGEHGDDPDLTRPGARFDSAYGAPAKLSDEPRIFIYDNYPGGIGFSEPLFGMHDDLLVADARADCRLRMRARLPDVCRPGRQHRSDGEVGGPADPRTGVEPRAGRCWHGPATLRTNVPACRRRRGAVLVSSLADRLRGIIAAVARSASRRRALPVDATAASRQCCARSWAASGATTFWSSIASTRRATVTGHVAVADAAPPGEGWSRLGLLGGGDSRCLFLDLETTGLAGGAGTYAFLVGLAWFDGCTFRVRQFFLASYAAERVLLEAVSRGCRRAMGTVVTYNGKSFDLPVLETRYVMNRMATPFAGDAARRHAAPGAPACGEDPAATEETRECCRLTDARADVVRPSARR